MCWEDKSICGILQQLAKRQDNFHYFRSEFPENAGDCSGDFLLPLSSVRSRRSLGHLGTK